MRTAPARTRALTRFSTLKIRTSRSMKIPTSRRTRFSTQTSLLKPRMQRTIPTSSSKRKLSRKCSEKRCRSSFSEASMEEAARARSSKSTLPYKRPSREISAKETCIPSSMRASALSTRKSSKSTGSTMKKQRILKSKKGKNQ